MTESRSAGPAATSTAFATVVILLGSGFVAIRYAGAQLGPFSGAAIQFGLPGGLFLVVALARGLAFPRGSQFAGALLYGGLNFGVNFALLFWGIQEVPPGMSAVIFATMPLSTLAFAIVFRMERFTGRALVGAIVALVGVAVVFNEGLRADVAPLRMFAIFLGSAAAAAGGIVAKRLGRADPIAFNGVGMWFAAALLATGAVVTGERIPGSWSTGTSLGMGWLVVATATAFPLRFWLLRQWTASAVSYQGVLQPLVAVAMSAALIGERPTPFLALGTAFVLAGLWIAVIRPGPRGTPAATPPS